MAVKFTIDDEALKRAAEAQNLDPDDLTFEVEFPDDMKKAVESLDRLKEAIAETAAVTIATAGKQLAQFAATAAVATKGQTLRELMFGGVSQEQWKEWEETAKRAALWAHEHNENMRLSAVYVERQVWRLLEDLADEARLRDERACFADHDDRLLSEATTILWVLETERDAGDSLAAELLESKRWGADSRKGRFVARLREHVATMRDAVGMGDGVALPDTEEDATRRADVGGDPLLWLDEAFAAYLDGLGETGPDLAAGVRERAQARWVAHQRKTADSEPENGRLLALWIDMAADSEERSALFPFLQRLALAVWRDVVRPELTAPEMAPSIVVVGGDDYTKLPKPTSAISWGFGGAGVAVDDNTFTAQPDAPRVQVVPKSWSIVQGEELQRQPHQTTLPLEFPGDTPLTLAMVGQPGTVIPSPGGKLLVLMLATAHGGDMTRGTLGELADYIYPDRRIQRSNLEQIAKVLNVADKLCAVLPDGTAIRCFDVRWPAVRVHRDQVVGWGMGRFFLDMARRATATDHGLRALRGEFVVNLTGIMRLPRKESMLRNYIQAAALWNDANTPGKPGDFNADYLKRYTVEQWAALVNTLSTAAVARDRRKLWRDKRDTLKDLEGLHDLNMVRLEREGKKGEIALLPPDNLLEARRLIRGGAARPTKSKK